MMRTWMQWGMRWGTCAVGVGLALVPGTGRAQEAEAAPEVRRTLVLALPLSGSAGQVGVGVEHVVGSHVTLAGAVEVLGALRDTDHFSPEGAGVSSESWGVGVDPGVHFYFTGRAPEGFWVGPHFELSTYRETLQTRFPNTSGGPLVTSEGTSRTVSYGGSARLGYTAIVSPGLTVQVGVGVAAQSSRYTSFTPRRSPDPAEGGVGVGGLGQTRSWSVAPRMTVGLGWAF